MYILNVEKAIAREVYLNLKKYCVESSTIESFLHKKFLTDDIMKEGGVGYYIKDTDKLESFLLEITQHRVHVNMYTALFDSPIILTNITFKESLQIYYDLKDELFGMLLKDGDKIYNPLNIIEAYAYKDTLLHDLDTKYSVILYKKKSNLPRALLRAINGKELGTFTNHFQRFIIELLSQIASNNKQEKEITYLHNPQGSLLIPRITASQILNNTMLIDSELNSDDSLTFEIPIKTNFETDSILFSVGVLNSGIIYPYYGICQTFGDDFTKAVSLTPLNTGNIHTQLSADLKNDGLEGEKDFIRHIIFKDIRFTQNLTDETMISMLDEIEFLTEETIGTFLKKHGLENHYSTEVYSLFLTCTPADICFGSEEYNTDINEKLAVMNQFNTNSAYTHDTLGKGCIDYINLSIDTSLNLYIKEL